MQHVKYGFVLAMSFGVVEAANEDIAYLYGSVEMISIATGTQQLIKEAPSVASVISREDIERSGATDITQLLERVAGVHVYPSTVYAMSPSYSIRGIHTGVNPQVLFLVNGVDVHWLYSGSRTEFFRYPLQNIERIEVLRGPGSAVFGADAFAGVINIITRTGSDIDGVEAGVKGGTFDDQYAWFQAGKQKGHWQWSLSYEHARSGGDDGRQVDFDLQSGLDAAFETQASIAPSPLHSGYQSESVFAELRYDDSYLSVRSWDMNSETHSGGAQALDRLGSYHVSELMVDGLIDSGKRWQDLSMSLRLNYHEAEIDARWVLLPPHAVVVLGEDGNLFTPGTNGPGGGPVVAYFPDGVRGFPGAIDKKKTLEWVSVYEGWENHQLRLSLGREEQKEQAFERKNFGPGVLDQSTIGTVEEIPLVVDGNLTDVSDTPFVYSQNARRDINHLSIQDVWDFTNDWSVTGGVRYDHYSDFGTTINPRLALVWSTSHDLTTKLLYGEAFRAPAFSELYARNNPVVLGNPDLKPEKIKTLELVLDYRPIETLDLALNVFHYQAKQLIEYVPQDNGTSIAQNAGEQKGSGFELETRYNATDTTTLIGNFSFQDSRHSDTNAAIADAPRQQLYLGLENELSERLTLFSQANWVMNRERALSDPRDKLDNYATLDMSLRMKGLFDNWNLGLTVRNLTDEAVVEPSNGSIADYPMEGRHFIGELSVAF